jgi:hypothetical protein
MNESAFFHATIRLNLKLGIGSTVHLTQMGEYKSVAICLCELDEIRLLMDD